MSTKHLPHTPHPLRSRRVEAGMPPHAGVRLREIRLALGLTQHDLGAALGLGGQEISRYETGALRPRAMAMKLAELLLEAHTRCVSHDVR